ncbi:glycosyltransferase [Polaribacter sp.]|nr:glycosyltransferase [Polaribacter sp.]
MIENKVAILLSTYNPNYELFVNQLKSIFNQDYKNIKLFIRDDGSSKSKLKEIEDLIKVSNFEVSLIKGENVGSKLSFIDLLNQVNYFDYYMFCDQDDFWYPNKVSKFLNTIKTIKSSKPSLVFGNMKVTNHKNIVISESFWNYQKINLNVIGNISSLIAHNPITACSCIFNNSAKKLLIDNRFDLQHDHLLGILIIFNKGTLMPLHDITMNYIQHSSNQLGAIKLKNSLGSLRSLLLNQKKILMIGRSLNVSFFSILYKKIQINLKRII